MAIRYTVGLRRTGNRTAEQAISCVFCKNEEQTRMTRKTGMDGIDDGTDTAQLRCFSFDDTSIVLLCYLLNTKKDRTMFVSTYVTKWKAP